MQHRLVAAAGVRRLQPLPVVYVTVAAWMLMIAMTAGGLGGAVRHDRLLVGGPPLWLATLLFIAGWQVMVWAMMTPASLHAFARIAPSSLVRFTIQYLAVWTVFGLALFMSDAALHQVVNHWSWLAGHAWVIAGTTLVACGVYQLSNLKTRALDACRTPSSTGAVHALQCIGSSGGLMLLSFALLPSSLVAMAAITLLMLFEVSPQGSTAVKPVGYALIAVGVLTLYGPIVLPG